MIRGVGWHETRNHMAPRQWHHYGDSRPQNQWMQPIADKSGSADPYVMPLMKEDDHQ